MKHISIEGMDGVGKTTVCRLLAENLGFEFVEKPFHFLLDEAGISETDKRPFETYRALARTVNKNPNRDFTSLFYGLGSVYMYERFKDKNIVTDRHLASNYAWSGTEENRDVYDLLVKKLGAPDLTVILYAHPEVIHERLKSRNHCDPNLSKIPESERIYERMIQFCTEKKFNHIVLDSSEKSPEEIADIIITIMEKE